LIWAIGKAVWQKQSGAVYKAAAAPQWDASHQALILAFVGLSLNFMAP